jgi:hypothetical protein
MKRATPTTFDYGQLTPDELLDHLLDENGLAPFIEIQQTGIPREEWDWIAITVHLQGFTRGYLTFSPEYLESLYEMQRERRADEVAA